MRPVPDPAPPPYIGPYTILETLGRGGMGTVYRARDERLGRDVAVKVVEVGEGDDTRRAERLIAETRAAAQLTHPNVMAVLDAGIDAGRPFMVSELIAGVSLRAELDRGPMPRARAVDLATQIAAGLAAAHEAQLVHRDLKPDNVMVTPAGVAKIVDFGLAKSLTPAATGAGDATLTAPHTVVGTVHYMSPEQARGAPADTRSDQFSFGAMLYEMLTGRRAFDRPSSVETLAAILKDEPPSLAEADPPVPAPLRWIVERCLAKAPDERYASTHDLWHDLKAVATRRVDAARPGDASGPDWRRAGFVATATAIAATAWFAASRSMPAAPPELPTWRRLTFEQGFVASARFSPDGQTVLYSASWDNRPFAVYSTSLTSPESRALDLPPAGLLAVAPSGELALSRDCQFVAASGACAGTLARAPLNGGAPRDLADEVRTADWGPDGALSVARRAGGNLLSVEHPLGTRISNRGTGYVRVAPDGAAVAWSEEAGANTHSVMLRDASGTRVLTTGWTFISGLAWSRDGNAVFVTGIGPGTVDDAVIRVQRDGRWRAVLRGMARLRVLDVAADDRLLVSASTTTTRAMIWNLTNDRPRDITWLGNSSVDALSQDGRRLLLTVRAGSLEFAGPRALYPIYVRELSGDPAVRIGSGYGVALSPDGRWALTRTRPESGLADLVLVPLGPGEPRTLPRGAVDVGSGNSLATFAGPERIVLRARTDTGPWRTFVQSLAGGPPEVVAHEPGEIVSPIAPDGDRFVARRSDASLWLARLDAGGVAAVPLSGPGRASILQWTDDGRGLVLLRSDRLHSAISRLDLASGRETPLRDIAASVEAGFTQWSGVAASRGGRLLASSEVRVLGALYLVQGIR